jgi:hypothetical protein
VRSTGVAHDRLGDLIADRKDRVERRRRLLEDQRDQPAPHPAKFGRPEACEVDTIHHDGSADLRIAGKEPQERPDSQVRLTTLSPVLGAIAMARRMSRADLNLRIRYDE